MEKQFVFDLLFKKAFEKRKVTLASGKESDFYFDCKQVTLDQKGMILTGKVFFNLIKELSGETDNAIIAGVSIGGDPLVCSTCFHAFLSDVKFWPALIRKEAKNYGAAKRVEILNDIDKSLPVYLLEDVVTTGGSSLKAVNALKEEGFNLKAVLALVDRESGGVDAFKEAGVPYHPIFTASQFLDHSNL